MSLVVAPAVVTVASWARDFKPRGNCGVGEGSWILKIDFMVFVDDLLVESGRFILFILSLT